MSLIPSNIVLENERVALRRLTEADVANLLTFAMDEPELWRFSLMSAEGEDGMKTYIDKAINDYDEGSSFPFIVYDKKTMQYAGSTRFYDIQPSQKSLQLGYTWYGKAFQGTGLNKNCKYLLLQYAFESLDFDRVEFRADASNVRSISAMKSIGCTVEGILRSHVFKHDGLRRDSIILSMLKEEWHSIVKKQLFSQIKKLL
jgi:RimJ/RimL family protein N-acetyltransferase